jgi:hypothetical protein
MSTCDVSESCVNKRPASFLQQLLVANEMATKVYKPCHTLRPLSGQLQKKKHGKPRLH